MGCLAGVYACLPLGGLAVVLVALVLAALIILAVFLGALVRAALFLLAALLFILAALICAALFVLIILAALVLAALTRACCCSVFDSCSGAAKSVGGDGLRTWGEPWLLRGLFGGVRGDVDCRCRSWSRWRELASASSAAAFLGCNSAIAVARCVTCS